MSFYGCVSSYLCTCVSEGIEDIPPQALLLHPPLSPGAMPFARPAVIILRLRQSGAPNT